ncbi:helix-turn-helix domain-containing protein [Nocardia terpenica]|uniref:XRE family transcriptional regulator n=1 Tax=Nocardia terpenica TaxID=455432 RepID=A0A291RJL4_9NOCA|nr:helix-turn-helix transcriptional regulator [Nocardia terpenica]ATL67488.1 XRE family transcriptional regulator [Nocardia terpenica]
MAGSTLPQRAMGRILAKLRDRAGLGQKEVGDQIGVSAQTVGRMEDGQPTMIGPLHIKELCRIYGASDEDRKILLSLVAEVKMAQRAGGRWWRKYQNEIPDDFNHYLALEEVASRVTAWQTIFPPGMLQIPSYRRETIWAWEPNLSTEAVEKRIELATRRQKRLEDKTFHMDIFLSESVLRYQVGNPQVTRDQLLHIADVMLLPNISIRAVRFRASGIRGLVTGPFALLEFPKLPSTGLTEPPVVYVEGYTGGLYLHDDPEITEYRRAVPEIGKVALSHDDTRHLVLQIAEEFAQ